MDATQLMSAVPPAAWFYAAPMLFIWAVYALRKRYKHARNRAIYAENAEAGLIEPPSLHPLIDPAKCLGCGSCVTACPEEAHHPVLGLVDGKARLIEPSNCIGHGACATACPFNAITLVFGSERRGVDIPVLDHFQTNVPGVFIAGELGGMGLIRNAIEQGTQAIERIVALDGIGDPQRELDLVIIGAGPAGFAAALAAQQAGLRCVTLEQESLGGAVFQYPRGKLVMTAPVELPGFGVVQFRETSKEELLEFWQGVEADSGVKINYCERVEAVLPQADGSVEVRSKSASYRSRAVLLAIGRRGTPRKLGVPGEELPKVVYRLVDAEQYRGRRVLVVGGGDSALEAAASIAEQPGGRVVLSYRGEAFTRAKKKNRLRVEAAAESGELDVLMSSQVREIRSDSVHIDTPEGRRRARNDAVIVCAGGVMPDGFLREIGIHVETKHGSR